MTVDNTLEGRISDLASQVRALRTTPWSRQITAAGEQGVYDLDELAVLAESGGDAAPAEPGEQGPPGAFSSVTVTMLDPGAAPTSTVGGVPGAQTLDLGIPSAASGTVTSASVTMAAYGTTPAVAVGGTPAARTLAFTLPYPPQPSAPQYVAGNRVAPGAVSTEQTWLPGFAIAYPGYPFRVWMNMAGRIFVNASTRVRIVLRCGSGAADLSLPIITDAWAQSNDVLGIDFSSPHRPTGAFTAAVRLVGSVWRTEGTGAYDLSAGAGVSYQVVPA